ncbi:uncharacterized protein [Rutidosis leptorrhynchoides]|uniref:uncharacterized protein n=1 Tax=Rutidosis leptorrhynchoides TaxID=125765 RepID=UPI003A9A4F76
MYVGGHVWALDWCPRVHQSSHNNINVEFIAVSAHPPESSYHKIGAPLSGRGLIQIWCIVNTCVKDQNGKPLVKVRPKKYSKNKETNQLKKRGRPKKDPAKESVKKISKNNETNLPKKRGRPRKNPVKESLTSMDANSQHLVVFSEKLNKHFLEIYNKTHEQDTLKVYTRKRKNHNEECSLKSMRTSFKSRLKRCKTRDNSQVNDADPPHLSHNCGSSLKQDPVLSEPVHDSASNSEPVHDNGFISEPVHDSGSISEPVHDSGSIPEDVALPRLVMGLAHNGKVAWDVKWRPCGSRVISKHVIGHLAVLLGNGALEVWEVPHPHATKAIFSSSQKEGTDPRFIKLKPILICSALKCADRKSIPLILEWSTSAPHDLIMAGCHDGVVALWKLSDNDPSKDTRPLLCFTADTAPIRALKWAPVTSDPDSKNIFVTAGHKSIKFWDLREPMHPLWDIPVQRIVNSLDWLPDPRCVVLSFDDGEIRIISLLKAANDVPVTGMPCVKPQQNGLNSYHCSSSSIWSVQVSITGMVAYCCSDGKVIHFQLTTKAVEKDHHRNREPHYLCGSLTEEESTLTVFSHLPNAPFSLKKSSKKCCDTPTTRRGFNSRSNQEKRAKDKVSKSQTSEKQPSGHNMYSESSLVIFQKNDTSVKSKTCQELVCIDDNNNNNDDNDKSNKSEEEDVKTEMANKEEEIEVFPSKMVAIHRVRWNMNKGSNRLLCSGGAAGIVRCQLII